MVQNKVRQDPADSLPGMDKYDVVVELWFDSLIAAANFASNTEVAAVFLKADVIDSAGTVTYVAADNPAAAEWLRRGQSNPLDGFQP